MKKYTVEIKETNYKDVEIIAESREEAEQMAEEMYSDGRVLMDNDDASKIDCKVISTAPVIKVGQLWQLTGDPKTDCYLHVMRIDKIEHEGKCNNITGRCLTSNIDWYNNETYILKNFTLIKDVE